MAIIDNTEQSMHQALINALSSTDSVDIEVTFFYFSGWKLDYIAYAVFQVYENKNREWYEIVKKKIGKIQDICNKKYFTRNNPL